MGRIGEQLVRPRSPKVVERRQGKIRAHLVRFLWIREAKWLVNLTEIPAWPDRRSTPGGDRAESVRDRVDRSKPVAESDRSANPVAVQPLDTLAVWLGAVQSDRCAIAAR
jgi:hypothetical protein